MTGALARALMALAVATLGESRRDWAAAMQSEFEIARDEGHALPFATGCLAAAWRQMLTREEGHFTLTTYGLVLVLLIPMAAFQIGSALFGLPYLYPAETHVPTQMYGASAAEDVLRNAHLAGVPSFALLLFFLGLGNLRLGWAMLNRDWSRVLRTATAMFAASTTLVLVMGVFFLDTSRALTQTAVLAIELATVALVARWHAQLSPSPGIEQPG